MAFDEKAFTEEIDVFITQAAEEAEADKVVETAVESGTPDNAELEGESDGLSSESELEGAGGGGEDSELDASLTDTGAASAEDGVEGDTVEVEGSQSTGPAAPVIGDEALTAAVRAGLSLKEAKTFTSEATLRSVVGMLNANVAKNEHYQDNQPASPNQTYSQESQEPAADPFASLPALDPEKYEPEAIEMFDGLKGAMQSALKIQQDQIDANRTAQTAANQAGQAASDREVGQWFDKEINSLADKLGQETLGEGGHGDQAQGSSQLAKRNEIAQQCAVLLAGYEASGQPMPPREEIFRVSARLVLADEYQASYEKDMSGSLAKQAGKHINRANGKKTKSKQSPEDETAAELDELYF